MVNLTVPVADTRLLLSSLHGVLDLPDGCGYKKVSVWLTDLQRAPHRPARRLFSPPTAGNSTLMATLDAISRRYGRSVAGLSASGWRRSPLWGMRQENLSPHFTTCVAELPRAF